MFSADLGGYTEPLPAATDPPFQKVALLLHGDGTNGAQNNTFVDSSSNNFTITRTGNVAQGTFSPFSLPEGQWSNYFDGSGDYLQVQSSSVVDFGTGDFTIELFVRYNTLVDYVTLLDSRLTTAGIQLFSSADGTLYYDVKNASNTQLMRISTTSGTLTANTWTHIAVCRSSGTTTVYVNGVSKGSASDSNSYTSTTNRPNIGANYSGTESLSGYISNVRIVKGAAVYISNFTPSTTPLTAISGTSLLTCQSNRFKDNSSNNFTITRNGDNKVTAFSPFAPSAAYSASTNGGSGYFDGTGDNLTLSSGSAFQFATGDFTVEFWVYLPSNPTFYYFIDARNSSQTGAWAFFKNSTLLEWYDGSTSLTSSTLPTVGQWNHVSYCRSGTTGRMFLNGVQIASKTDTKDYNVSPTTSYIASRYSSTEYFNGYLADLRVVKGTALYTSNFTPPTAPLTAVANTQLLLNCTNAGIYDNAGKNDIETVGNAQVSTSVKKYGTGSMAFDGSGARLYSAFNGDIGSGDFTLEAWIYPTTINNTHGILATPNTNTGSWVFGLNSSGNLRWFANATSNTVNLNKWNHIVACRASGSIRLFINGILGATISDTTNYSQSPFVIGTERTLTVDYFGYIDDLRITKGQALYTANFTPPTQAFPNV